MFSTNPVSTGVETLAVTRLVFVLYRGNVTGTEFPDVSRDQFDGLFANIHLHPEAPNSERC